MFAADNVKEMGKISIKTMVWRISLGSKFFRRTHQFDLSYKMYDKNISMYSLSMFSLKVAMLF